ncbi:alpha-tocopherol transfer protein-like [Daktulosphaira vitifoliae]|uniref:alpha-tocopherol transfer protein-like n=1 Tax=Daktulosphaira vitifoliae TaxID=58002 RepID=UPI0021AAD6FD|nr:alpha-tocopherol transfer protein-like [Daktulosphaira vitifoliae]
MIFFKKEEEFKKNPELKDEDLNHLKEWLSKQPHLPHVNDEQLILFLHSCFYRLESTKATIESYFTLRTHSPELFTKRDSDLKNVSDAFSIINFCLLSESTPEGDRVVLIQGKELDPECFVLPDFIKALSMVLDMLLMTSGTFNGLIIVYDMKGFTLGHIGRMGIGMMKKYIFYLQEGLQARLKAIHVINTVPIIDIINNMIKPFMKKELAEKQFYHVVGSEDIFKYIPRNIMPSDVGGTGKSIAIISDETFTKVKEMKSWFIEEEKFRVNEQKRPGKPKTESDYFGMDGSFKTLSID